MRVNLKIVLFMLVVASCSHDSKESEDSEISSINCLVPVTVQVKDFSITQEGFDSFSTRTSTSAADYSSVKAITLAFYSGETEVYKKTQLKSDNSTFTTFGNFSCSLPMGNYTMVVLGYGFQEGDVLTLTNPVSASYTSGRVRETFVSKQDVNINSNSEMNLTATLDRIVSKLDVKSTDGRTENATNVCVTFSAGSKAFSPTTGLSTDNMGFSNTVTVSAEAGETIFSSNYLFLNSDEQTMNVTIKTLDSNGNVLFSKVVNDVPFKRNRKTILIGSMYTNESVNSAFQLNTDWITENTVNF